MAIMSLAYRTVAKWMANDMQATMARMDERSAGGLPRRAAIDAWFDIMALLEKRKLEAYELEAPRDLFAIQIDTEKFFDAVPHSLAADLMNSQRTSTSSSSPLHHQIVHHVKYLFLGVYCNPEGFNVSRGIPQGDAVSMYGALVTMEHWMNALSPGNLNMRCYVDDRFAIQS